MAGEERWVSVQDVAAHLGVAKDSVYRWIDEKGLPAHRVGRLFRFKLSEIDEWVRQDIHQETASNPKRKHAPLRAGKNRSRSRSRSDKKAKNE
ncbi:MAG: DNA-binding protein [Deltaproteobacteria bacterium]|nr:MAG: DNA-binding protein [Deltaproteobacteria bacterium]